MLMGWLMMIRLCVRVWVLSLRMAWCVLMNLMLLILVRVICGLVLRRMRVVIVRRVVLGSCRVLLLVVRSGLVMVVLNRCVSRVVVIGVCLTLRFIVCRAVMLVLVMCRRCRFRSWLLVRVVWLSL